MVAEKCSKFQLWILGSAAVIAVAVILATVLLAKNDKFRRTSSSSSSNEGVMNDDIITTTTTTSPVSFFNETILSSLPESTPSPSSRAPIIITAFPSLRPQAPPTIQPSPGPTTAEPTTAPTAASSFQLTMPTSSPSGIPSAASSASVMTGTTPTNQPALSPTATPSTRVIVVPSPSPTEATVDATSQASTFLDCLGAIGNLEIVTSQNAEYAAAKQCLVYPPSTISNPTAIVRPSSAEMVASSVSCAATFGVTVTARSGAHSFVAQSCRGEMIVDLSLLDSLVVNTQSSTVTWGAGQLHGQLYARLIPYGLILPGGSESMVGTGGLWLGCGRGYLTQAYGYSCDQMLSIEYVDSQGNIKIANTRDNADMFWMARGGGGFFPGIVTKITAQAHPMPQVINHEECLFDHAYLRQVIKIWTKYLDQYNNPNNMMFSGLLFDREPIKIEWNCFGCQGSQLTFYNQLKSTIKTEISMQSGGFAILECTNKDFNFEQKLLSRQWDACDTYDCLLSRSKWPEWRDNNNMDLSGSAYNGAIMIPQSFQITDALIDEIVTYFQSSPGEWQDRKYLDFMTLYPMMGKNSANVDPLTTAYGGRDAKMVIHFKKDRIDSNPPLFKAHMDAFEQNLIQNHGLPCKSFYNYQDNDLQCATNEDEYLAAFFSNPNRMRRIVRQQDPNGVFYRPPQSSYTSSGGGGTTTTTNPQEQQGPSSSSSSWVSTSGPIIARHEGCFVAVESNNKAYLIGGRGVKPVNELDRQTGTWTTKSTTPIELHHMQCVVVDDNIFILNAWTGQFPYEMNVEQILVYHTSTDSWTGRVGLPEPRQRGGGASVLVTNPVDGTREIHVSHGNRGGHGVHSEALPWYDKYNVDLNVWITNLPDAPNARDHAGGALVNGMLCVAGGRDSGVEGYLNKPVLATDCFNFATGSWEVKANIPQGRAGSAYGRTCDGKMVVAGGEGFGQAWANVDVFDGTSWTSLNPLLQGRHGTGLATFCGCGDILIASGSGSQGGLPELQTTERIITPGSTCQ